ncbi:Serine/threonine-protein kinase RAD53 [Penicillium taxi]|uniref:Serine/threonine-protein kinase RAD53 n=1 Tax=Penicillium taxi TaxID=168475 RepID=UPI0025455FC5|nr:Serine/threonine-protein kinase RAD53 [Penicillium taxi]KAJ5885518.1 Serine/threonine-protein kinase RAD53 [Penicillium taxi]
MSVPSDVVIGREISQDLYEFEMEGADCALHKRRLELGDKLGSGSFGAVFEATISIERPGKSWKHYPVAVKTASREPGNMIIGAYIETTLQSDYIVPMHDTFFVEKDHEAFAVMPRATNGHLGSYIHKYDIPEKDANQIFKGILLGLKEMHNNGIMHRDLKPDNILMFNTIPKIADFDTATYDELSKKFNVGTTGYLAPGIWQGS